MKKYIMQIALLFLILFNTGCFDTKNSQTQDVAKTNNNEKENVLTIAKGSGAEQIRYFDFSQEEGEKRRYAAQSFTVDNENNIYILNGYEKTVKVYKDEKYIKTINLESEGEFLDIYYDDKENNIKVLDNKGSLITISENIQVKLREAISTTAEIGVKRGTENGDYSYFVNSIVRGEAGIPVVKYENNLYKETGAVKRSKTSEIDGILNKLYVRFSSGKGYKSFLGYDADQNVYILTTELISNSAGIINVEQKVVKFSRDFSNAGEVIIKKEKEFTIANKNILVRNNGEVYQLLNLKNEVKVIKLSLTANYSTNVFNMMDEIDKFDNRTFVDSNKRTALSLSRTDMYNRAVELANLSWTFDPAKNSSKASDVLLPLQFKNVSAAAIFIGVPYCWGGWNSSTLFKTNISNSYSAGNVNCTGNFKSYTAGVDCSGFVSQVIGNSTKLATSTIATSPLFSAINAANLDKMDLLNDSGNHVVFYLSTMSDGSIKTIEATTGTSYGGIQGVKFYTRNLAELTNEGYLAKTYKNIEPEYTITVTTPTAIFVGTTVNFSGKALIEIAKIKVLLDGITLMENISVTNGKYNFDYNFASAGVGKVLELIGYNLEGGEVARVSKSINVQSSIIFTLPSTLKTKQTTVFSGICSPDIIKIKRVVSGSTIRDIELPINGKFQFEVIFSSKGSKTLTLYGYDASGKEVIVSKTFVVEE